MTLEKLRRLVSLDADDPLSRFALGKKLLEVGQAEGPAGRRKVAEAEGHLRFSLSRDSTHLASYFNLARCLVELRRYSDARPVILAGLERTAAVGEGMGRDLGPALEQMLGELPDVRLVGAEGVVDLRHRVLRQGLPRESAVFPGDELETTLHAVAFVAGAAASCGTMMLRPLDDHPDRRPVPEKFDAAAWAGKPVWRLRGMATDAGHRSKGLGGEVLRLLEREAAARLATGLFWCNARLGAVRFYELHGWRVVTAGVYEIPTAGPHHTMVKEMGS
jgi:GNAT superfamily N-acetyltransferase